MNKTHISKLTLDALGHFRYRKTNLKSLLHIIWTFVFNGVEIPYGVFLGEVINFLIVAAAMFFFIVKFLGWMMNVKKEEPVVVLTKQEELLIEIRDLLKAKAS